MFDHTVHVSSTVACVVDFEIRTVCRSLRACCYSYLALCCSLRGSKATMESESRAEEAKIRGNELFQKVRPAQ